MEEEGDKYLKHYVKKVGQKIEKICVLVSTKGPRVGISPAYWRWLSKEENKIAHDALVTSKEGVYMFPQSTTQSEQNKGHGSNSGQTMHTGTHMVE